MRDISEELRTLQEQLKLAVELVDGDCLVSTSERERIERINRFGENAFLVGDFVIKRRSVVDAEPTFSRHEISQAVMQCCTCGGGGPEDKHTCPACHVYHALTGKRLEHSPDCDVNDINPDGIKKPCNCQKFL